jgi:hypothetical protein
MKRRHFLTAPIALLFRGLLPLQAQTTPDFHLQSGSPAIGAGMQLSEVTVDADGKVRPNPPSIGAYEYAGSTPWLVPPPTGFKFN